MSSAKRRLSTARKKRSQARHVFDAMRVHDVTLPDVLGDPPDALRKLRIYDVLRRAPKLGSAGADAVLRRSNVWPTKTLGSLSETERQALIRNLPPRAKSDVG